MSLGNASFVLRSNRLSVTDISKNGGDDKSKNMERNPSNILPGQVQSNCLDPASRCDSSWRSLAPLSLSPPIRATRRVLHLAALQPVRGARRLPPVRGRQRALGQHHGSRPGHHGLEKHPEGVLHPRHHHHHRTSAAGPQDVGGTSRSGR